MFVTLHIILKNIIKGVILRFLSFFLFIYCLFQPCLIYGSEAFEEKAEFNYFPIFMEYFLKHARIYK